MEEMVSRHGEAMLLQLEQGPVGVRSVTSSECHGK